MNPLEHLHITIDQGSWDEADKEPINKEFQKVNQKLAEEKNENILHLSEIERQAFAFNKSPEKRLSFFVAGDKTLEDSSKVPFEWPDVKTFSKEDFSYLIKRFKECKNIFAQSEYGLVVYYAGELKQNKDVLLLLQKLFELAKSYVNKAKNDDNNLYALYYRTVLANSLHIAENRKKDDSILNIYKKIIHFTFEVHQNWETVHKDILRTVIDLTDFAIRYFKDFNEVVDINTFLTKNWEAAKYLAKANAWGAIYVADISIRLCKKLNTNQTDWLLFKATQYEKLAEEAK